MRGEGRAEGTCLRQDNPPDDEEEPDGALDDADGSAKVALFGIELSLGTWTILRDAFPAEDAQIQNFQRYLARLRRMLDADFPAPRTFRRPGFYE